MEENVLLRMEGICKSFPGVKALDNAQLSVRAGTVHALMGENGAGKSTLMKVLTGIYHKDAGTITYEGKEVEFTNPREAQDAGIVIVHQELNMMGHLTVAQNIFIGREYMNGKLIDDKKMNEEAKKLFDQLGINIDPKETMSRLTVGKQQMCEIAKAISHDAKVIIFDEPSAALTEAEIEELFKIIRDLRDKQMGIVYISHRMDEIKMITDRVEAAVDTCISSELPPEEWDVNELNQLLIPIIPLEPLTPESIKEYKNNKELKHSLKEKAVKLYEAKEAEFPDSEAVRELERVILLKVIDRKWMDHIDDMDQLRQGIGLQAYGQKDPLVEYKMSAYEMFDAMSAAIQEDTLKLLYHVSMEQKVEREEVAKVTGTNKDDSVQNAPQKREEKKIYPNDPCPCGSGKKYKQCCGRKIK